MYYVKYRIIIMEGLLIREERFDQILEKVNDRGYASVSDLSKYVGVSEVTIRRDLIDLENKNLLKKVHGGAKSLKKFFDKNENYQNKMTQNADLKKEVAELASKIIKHKDIIFLGAGATSFFITNYIHEKEITVVTNSQIILEVLSNYKNIKLICTGGTYRQETKSYIGPLSEKVVSDMRFNKCFIGVNGIDTECVYTSSLEASILYSKVLDNSASKYIIADHNKFNIVDFTSFYKTKEISTIITDDKIDKTLLRQFARKVSIINKKIYKRTFINNED